MLPRKFLTSDAAAFSHGKYLYVVGGYDVNYVATEFTIRLDTEEIFQNPVLNGGNIPYHQMSDMKIGRGSHSVVSYSHFAFVVGGYTHNDNYCASLKNTDRLNIFEDTWEEASNLNIPLANTNMVKFNSQFFTIGGEVTNMVVMDQSPGKTCMDVVPSNTIEILDPSMDFEAKWKMVERRPDNDYIGIKNTAVPWLATQSIYIFGGLIPSLIDDENEFGIGYEAWDEVIVFNYSLENENVALWNHAGLGSGVIVLCLILFLGYFSRRKSLINSSTDDCIDNKETGAIGLTSIMSPLSRTKSTC